MYHDNGEIINAVVLRDALPLDLLLGMGTRNTRCRVEGNLA